MKTSFAMILAFICNSGNAQIPKGSVFLGGNFGGSVLTTTKNGTTSSDQKGLTISPVYGKAIKDNLIAGAGFLFEITKDKLVETFTDQKQAFYGLQFFLRKYKTLGNSSFSIFAEGGLKGEYSPFNQLNTSSLEKQKRNVTMLTLYAYPGVSYKISRKLHLETGFANLLYIQYLHQKYVITSSTTTTVITNNLGVGASLDNSTPFYIGFRLLISK